MARRSLSDQRHLLVELELDETVLADAVRTTERHHHQHLPASSRRRSQDAARSTGSGAAARPSSATTRRRASLDRNERTPSPFKLKQKVWSSRVDDDNPASARGRAMPSPLLLIVDAVRENTTQRNRVLLDVQDELRRALPPTRRRGNGPPMEYALLSPRAVTLLNRLRSLTLSIVEMIRYFHEQLPASRAREADPAVWAWRYEFQETLARLSASDLDGLLAVPVVTLFLESLGVPTMRNPFLDGVALDSSELLLCSCQAMGSSAASSSSLFQLVVARLEAFAIHVRRQYPSWQTLPVDRVARALLDLLESENKAHATRMLPSYLRPERAGPRYDTAPYYERVATQGEDSDEELEEPPHEPVTTQAWVDVAPSAPTEPSRRQSLQQVLGEPPTASTRPQQPLAVLPVPVAKPSPRLMPEIAEPKVSGAGVLAAKSDLPLAKKSAKRRCERSVTLGALGAGSGETLAPTKAETKSAHKQTDDPLSSVREQDDDDLDDEHSEHTRETIASALNRLPQFSLASLGISMRKVTTRAEEAPPTPAPNAPAPEAEIPHGDKEDSIPVPHVVVDVNVESKRDAETETEPFPRHASPRPVDVVATSSQTVLSASTATSPRQSDAAIGARPLKCPTSSPARATSPRGDADGSDHVTPRTTQSPCPSRTVSPREMIITSSFVGATSTDYSSASPDVVAIPSLHPENATASRTASPRDTTSSSSNPLGTVKDTATSLCPEETRESELPRPDLVVDPSVSPRETSPLSPHVDHNGELDPLNLSELSRILSLCRDVQVAAIDLSERLHPYVVDPSGHSIASIPSSATPLMSPPRFPLSTRYLERELKMLRRYFRVWLAARLDRHERLQRLRVACAARRIGRFGRCGLARKRERELRLALEQRHRMVQRIQRRWRVYCAHQQRRRRQHEFHVVHRCFQRHRFFTRVAQRRRRRERAVTVLQRWWQRVLRAREAAEQQRQHEQRQQERRQAAARHLQAFVKEHTLRRKLAEALEANRRLHMMQNLKAVKARDDETKRRQLEAKRLAELKVTMQLALCEMEAKWKQAEAEHERLTEQQAKQQELVKLEAETRRRQLARERIDRFMELSVLRRRLRASVRANDAIALAKRELEHVRRRLERRHREDQAKRLLQCRMLWWKVDKSVQHARSEASDARWRVHRQRLRERDEASQKLHAQIRTTVAQSRVEQYCGHATQSLLETTYRARLAAKHDEAQRLRRQAARERIAAFVQQCWATQQLTQTRQEAERLHRELRETTARAAHAREHHHRQQLREQSARVVAIWITKQVARVRETRVVAAVRRQAQDATRIEMQRRVQAVREAAQLRLDKEQLIQQHRRHEQLTQLQRRNSERKIQQFAAKQARAEAAGTVSSETLVDQQRQRLLAQIQRHQLEHVEHQAQLERERQLRMRLVDVMVDTHKIVDRVVTTAVTLALAGVHATCERVVLATTYRRLLQRAWLREVCRRWRRFVQRRHVLAAVTTQALWPSTLPVAAAMSDHTQSHQRRATRLGELRRATSARIVQRCWRGTCKRMRQWKRQEVKKAEDELIARTKQQQVVVLARVQDEAQLKLSRWLRRVARNRRLRFRLRDTTAGSGLYFAGGRAWASAAETIRTRIRFDRVVTRKLLQTLDPSIYSRSDVERLLRELWLDLEPIVTTATISPRTTALADGSLELGDVDELELPRFSLVTRQLGKTRSMVKRQQLLDAKAASSSCSQAGLTIFDAVETASLDDAQFLLLQGADLHAREPCHQRTALHMLAFSGEPLAQRIAMLQFLVDRAKLDPYARDDTGHTVLMTFAMHGCVAFVESLLQRSPELWRETTRDGRNAFHCACDQDQPEVAAALQRFVVRNATTVATKLALLRDLYAPDKRGGATPLHTLATRGLGECLHVVMASVDEAVRPAILNQRDAAGRTPLHLAVVHGHSEVVRELLELGVDASIGDTWQRRPLHYATRVASAAEVILMLADRDRVDLNASDARGDTALHYAAASGRTQAVRQLLVLGADPNVLNGDWERPAHVAAAHRHVECARLLLPASVSGDDPRRWGLDGSARGHDVAQDLASAKSYCIPTATTVSATRAVGKTGDIDWDELHHDQNVELVEESGHFSSEEDEAETDATRWDTDDEGM